MSGVGLSGTGRLLRMLSSRDRKLNHDMGAALLTVLVAHPAAQVHSGERFDKIESGVRRAGRVKALGKPRPIVQYVQSCCLATFLKANMDRAGAMLQGVGDKL